MLTRSIRMARIAQRVRQLCERSFVGCFENSLLRANAKHDFLHAAKRSRNARESRLRKLEPAPAEGNLRGRQHRDFAIRQNLLHARNRISKTLASRRVV